ncbi:PilZ domain-containing protein [Sphingosinicella rhizophila]|uniref:PilZ domain-containing protein n=1 Tax=Sphingosinicella rhizophila TaxID=3050082 RepID=A0ABU3Q735_9SPHN|nr:PilZ domain-containing protein [Sphingosinicella sp. GR2756]MDT9599223.1 PilZ domain-containing protein [Sphingosinicella sp. GR2756]
MGLLTAQQWVERREPRTKVLIAIRVRGDGLATEACLRDVSSRGVLVQTGKPPPRGTIVELIGPFQPMVGRVVWSSGRRFGAELREHLNVKALTTGSLDRRRLDAEAASAGGVDRRARAPARQSCLRVGPWLQKGAVMLIGATVAISMALIAYDALADATQSVQSALTDPPAPSNPSELGP